jgi:hypothetical protein
VEERDHVLRHPEVLQRAEEELRVRLAVVLGDAEVDGARRAGQRERRERARECCSHLSHQTFRPFPSDDVPATASQAREPDR